MVCTIPIAVMLHPATSVAESVPPRAGESSTILSLGTPLFRMSVATALLPTTMAPVFFWTIATVAAS